LAEGRGLWRVFVLDVWIVVGCADVQKISVSIFSRFLDEGRTVLCFECTVGVAAFSGTSKREPGYWCAVKSLCLKNNWHSEIDGG
jgi:hypothetical protein